MTSPIRETEAQQVEAKVELEVRTKAKARLKEKRGTIGVNLVQVKTTTDQGLVAIVSLKVKEAALNQEKATAAISDQEQAAMAMLKILKAGPQEMAKEAASNQERVTAAISDREPAKMAKEVPSDLRVQEALADHRVSNHGHSKKAVPKKCREMKVVVM